MSGKYQAYPEYKDSGYPWLGIIPCGWVVSKVRYLAECLDNRRVPLNATDKASYVYYFLSH